MPVSGTVITLAHIRDACRECSLRELCLPLGLGAEDMAALDRIVKRRRPLAKGEVLYRMGDTLTSLYAIRSGAFKTAELLPDGRGQISGFHLAGELLGIDAINADRHPCTAEALEPSEVCELPFARLEKAAREIPGLQHQLLRLMSGQIRQDETLMLMLGKMSAEERLAAWLVSFARRRERLGQRLDRFRLSMSRQDLGDYLGLALETVSRLFSRFQEEGLLAVQGKNVEILDLARLEGRLGAAERSRAGKP